MKSIISHKILWHWSQGPFYLEPNELPSEQTYLCSKLDSSWTNWYPKRSKCRNFIFVKSLLLGSKIWVYYELIWKVVNLRGENAPIKVRRVRKNNKNLFKLKLKFKCLEIKLYDQTFCIFNLQAGNCKGWGSDYCADSKRH